MKMNFGYLFLTLSSSFLATADAGATFVPDFQIERCAEYKGMEANIVDTSDMEIHIENDTHAYFNGQLKFNDNIKSLPTHLYAEHYDRGQWITQVFDRTYDDMCLTAHDKSQPFYPNLNSFPECPLESGTIWTVDMVQFSLSEMLLDNLPHHYCGKWRATIIMEFMVDGEKKSDCRRVYGDIFDDGKAKGLGNIVG
ncbi:uncharacterized protein [Chironomus tepperi]|uniref:uncharacterized protein n=1 Tax=Chironomus tepperi TaxID=113505 RepID=UPI00391F82F6